MGVGGGRPALGGAHSCALPVDRHMQSPALDLEGMGFRDLAVNAIGLATFLGLFLYDQRAGQSGGREAAASSAAAQGWLGARGGKAA